MAPSFDELLESVLYDVAIAGDRGIGLEELIQAVKLYYESHRDDSSVAAIPSDGLLFSTSPPASTSVVVDERLIATIWTWLTEHPDIKVQAAADAADPSSQTTWNPQVNAQQQTFSSTFSSSYTGLRITSNEQRVWHAITGHEVDFKRVPPKEFEILCVVARHGARGCLQPEVTKATGQDKRSVPKRTDNLQSKGYIVKDSIISAGSRTTNLTLRRFAKASRNASERIPIPTSAAQAPDKEPQFYDEWFNILMKVLQENDGVAALDDIRLAIGISGDTYRTKQFRRCWIRLLECNCLRRITAEVQEFGGSVRCLQLLRQPTEQDRMVFQAARVTPHPREEIIESYGATSKASYDDDDFDYDNIDENGDLLQRSLAQWTPDVQYMNMIYNVVHNAGVQGISSMDLNARTTGPVWRRSLDEMLLRVTELWQSSQPPHLRHLGIIKDTGISGRLNHYVYRSRPNFEKAVELGLAAWEAVQDISKNAKGKKKAASSTQETRKDQFGFPAPNLRDFPKEGYASLRECQKNAALFMQEVKNSKSTPITKGMRTAGTQRRQQSRKPRNKTQRKRSSKAIPNEAELEVISSAMVSQVPSLLEKEIFPSGGPATRNIQPPKPHTVTTKKEVEKYKSHATKLAKKLAEAEAKSQGGSASKERIEEIQSDILAYQSPGVYIRPPGSKELWLDSKGMSTRGRPPNNCIVVFKSERLNAFEWFAADTANTVRVGKKRLISDLSVDGLLDATGDVPEQPPAKKRKSDDFELNTTVRISEDEMPNPPLRQSNREKRPSKRKSEALREPENGPESLVEDLAQQQTVAADAENGIQLAENGPKLPRKRGRPRKKQRVESLVEDTAQQQSVATHSSAIPPLAKQVSGYEQSSAPVSAAVVPQTQSDHLNGPEAMEDYEDPLQTTLPVDGNETGTLNMIQPASAKSTMNTNGQMNKDAMPNLVPNILDTKQTSSSQITESSSISGPYAAMANEDMARTTATPSVPSTVEHKPSVGFADSSSFAGLFDLTPVASATGKMRNLPGRAKNMVHIRRERLALELVRKCNGMFPGHREMWHPFITAWRRHSTHEPDRSTVDHTINTLCSDGKLVKYTFEFTYRGSQKWANILLEPHIDPKSDRVKLVQKAIIEAHPLHYVPEEVEIAADLNSKAIRVLELNKENEHPEQAEQLEESELRERSEVFFVPQSPERPLAEQFPDPGTKRYQPEFPAVKGVKVKRTAAAIAMADLEARKMGFDTYRNRTRISKRSLVAHMQQSLAEQADVESRPGNPFATRANQSTKLDARHLHASALMDPEQRFSQASGTFATNFRVASFGSEVTPARLLPKIGPPSLLPGGVEDLLGRARSLKEIPVRSNDNFDAKFFNQVDLIEKWETNKATLDSSWRPQSQHSFINLGIEKDHITPSADDVAADIVPQKRGRRRRSDALGKAPNSASGYQTGHKESSWSEPTWNSRDDQPNLQQHVIDPRLEKAFPPMIRPVVPRHLGIGNSSLPSSSASAQATATGYRFHTTHNVPKLSQSMHMPPHIPSGMHANPGELNPLYSSRKRPAVYDKLDQRAKRRKRDSDKDHLQSEHDVGRTQASPIDYDRFMIAAALCKLICHCHGDASMPWAFLNHAMGLKISTRRLQQSWAYARRQRGGIREVRRLQNALEGPFLKAYESGRLGVIDFEHPEQADWQSLLEWAAKSLAASEREKQSLSTKSRNAPFRLSASREAMRRRFDVRTAKQQPCFDRELYFEDAREYVRTDTILATAFGRPVTDSVEASEVNEAPDLDQHLILIKSIARSIALTPEKDYSAELAARKIASVGLADLKKASAELLQSKTFTAAKANRQLPGRNYQMHKSALQEFERWKTNTKESDLFLEVAVARARLAEHFTHNAHLDVVEDASEAENLVLRNMVAQGHILLLPLELERDDSMETLPPKISAWGWRNRKSHQQTQELKFPHRYTRTAAFSAQDGLKRGVPIRLEPKLITGEARTRVPMWVDINGNPMENIWTMVIRSVLHLLVFRPGSTAKNIEAAHGHKLWAWEIEMALGWMKEVGIAERFGAGKAIEKGWKGGWRVSDWWYCAFMPGVLFPANV